MEGPSHLLSKGRPTSHQIEVPGIKHGNIDLRLQKQTTPLPTSSPLEDAGHSPLASEDGPFDGHEDIPVEDGDLAGRLGEDQGLTTNDALISPKDDIPMRDFLLEVMDFLTDGVFSEDRWLEFEDLLTRVTAKVVSLCGIPPRTNSSGTKATAPVNVQDPKVIQRMYRFNRKRTV